MPTTAQTPAEAWQAGLIAQIDELAAACLPLAALLGQKLASVVTVCPVPVYYDGKLPVLTLPVRSKAAAWELSAVQQACEDVCEMVVAPGETWGLVKVAESNALHTLAEYGNLVPGHYGPIPNAPGPVAATLTGGVLGGALGYGSGWLAEKLFPAKWQRGRLSRTLGMLGAGVGMTPGMLWSGSNWANGRQLNDNSALNTPPASEMANPYPPLEEGGYHIPAGDKAASLNLVEQKWIEKLAFDEFGGSLTDIPELRVDTDSFNHVLWSDGDVRNRLNPETRGALSGALYAAQQMPGGFGAGLVTPMQMAHLAAGMGSGYLAGAVAGTGLALLTGAPPSVQDTLKRSGMWAGFANVMAQKLFGG